MKRWLPKIALALASVLLSVLFAEWVVSRWLPQATYAVHFAPWGFEHIPSIHFRHSSESYETVTEIRYNGEGFRASREFAVAKEAGIFRIAVLGDSYAEGVEVNEAALH